MKLPTAIFREYDIRGTVGDQLTAEVGRAIGQAVATLGWQRLGRAPGRPGGGRSEDGSVLPRYRDAIVQRNGPLPRKVKVVVDCGNGVASLIAVDTLERLGAEVVPLFCESDGTFPNHHPDPSALENLRDRQAAVRREGGELGIAFDDALFAAARLLRYVADQGGPLSRLLADLPVTVATPELRVDCADDRKFEIVQRAAKHFASKFPVSTLDGVRITFAQGWGLLRASNTQPVLVLRFEAASESALASYRTEVESWLAAQSPGA